MVIREGFENQLRLVNSSEQIFDLLQTGSALDVPHFLSSLKCIEKTMSESLIFGSFSSRGKLQAAIVYQDLGPEKQILYLRTDFRLQRKGIMRALLASFVDKLQAGECLWLEVRQGNHKARNLYTSLGFVQNGVRAAYYSDGEPAVQYQWGA